MELWSDMLACSRCSCLHWCRFSFLSATSIINIAFVILQWWVWSETNLCAEPQSPQHLHLHTLCLAFASLSSECSLLCASLYCEWSDIDHKFHTVPLWMQQQLLKHMFSWISSVYVAPYYNRGFQWTVKTMKWKKIWTGRWEWWVLNIEHWLLINIDEVQTQCNTNKNYYLIVI